jgi:N-acetylmuramoyl-L-alanine amidase CwlA
MPEPLGKTTTLTLHWTAGGYTQTFDDYHFCVKGDGAVVQTLSISKKGAHTWKRNSGNIGVSMCCMADGCPVTDKQREATARLVAELCGMFGLDVERDVHDHAYFARLDGYYPERWDVGEELTPIKAKAKWYRIQIKSGEMPNRMQGKVK